MNRTLLAAGLLPVCVGAGRASFATVRSAEVTPGTAMVMEASLAVRPEDEASWFFRLDCEVSCDRSIASSDLAFAYGVSAGSDVPFTIGGGSIPHRCSTSRPWNRGLLL